MLRSRGLELRLASLDDFPMVFQLEAEGYPEDEMASEDKMKYRVEHANPFFVVCTDPSSTSSALDSYVGFINGTCIEGNTIPKESMSTHISHGRTLVIHSVTVSSSRRRQGIASAMLTDYLSMLKAGRLVDTVLLLCKANLISFYKSVGFVVNGLSSVVHGQDHWFEMTLRLQEFQSLEQWQVDAFTEEAFKGNPAAVVFVQRDDKWMQQLAMENNYAETAFLRELPEHGNHSCYSLRWFTPVTEVALCGHATLASAHALYESGRVNKTTTIHFHTLSGILECSRDSSGRLSLNFPSNPPIDVPSVDIKNVIKESLGLSDVNDVVYVGKSTFDVFVELTPESFAALDSIDMAKLSHLSKTLIPSRGLIVTTKGGKHDHQNNNESSDSIVHNKRFDFVSRCFFPLCGVNEDPVTGSAHCTIAPYWRSKLGYQINDTMTGYQSSSRGGILSLRVLPDDRIELSGTCVTTIIAKIIT